MVIAALKSLTWATVAGAVVSAVLLAYGGITMPRIAGTGPDPILRNRAASTASPATAQAVQATAAQRADTTPPQGSPR
jgi:hypothetical protein